MYFEYNKTVNHFPVLLLALIFLLSAITVDVVPVASYRGAFFIRLALATHQNFVGAAHVFCNSVCYHPFYPIMDAGFFRVRALNLFLYFMSALLSYMAILCLIRTLIWDIC